MQKSDPPPPLQESERDRWNFDAGYERGWGDRNSEVLDKVEQAIEKLIGDLQRLAADLRSQ